jgi:hypothetical protein
MIRLPGPIRVRPLDPMIIMIIRLSTGRAEMRPRRSRQGGAKPHCDPAPAMATLRITPHSELQAGSPPEKCEVLLLESTPKPLWMLQPDALDSC